MTDMLILSFKPKVKNSNCKDRKYHMRILTNYSPKMYFYIFYFYFHIIIMTLSLSFRYSLLLQRN